MSGIPSHVNIQKQLMREGALAKAHLHAYKHQTCIPYNSKLWFYGRLDVNRVDETVRTYERSPMMQS